MNFEFEGYYDKTITVVVDGFLFPVVYGVSCCG